MDQAASGNLMGGNAFDTVTFKCDGSLKGNLTAAGAALDAFFPQDQPGDCPEDRRFAGTIRTDQTDQFALLDVQTDVVENHGFVVADCQIGHFQ